MSLPGLALRLLTVAAISGRTDAEDNVRDSQIRTADDLAKGDVCRAIAVYVEEVTAARGFVDVGAGEGLASLVFEIVTLATEDGENYGVPTTDAGLEIALDLIEHQIRLAILDAENSWANLWRTLVVNQSGYKFQRGANKDENGRRYAAREITISLGLLSDPPIGVALPQFWVDFKAALVADERFTSIREPIIAAIDGVSLAPWRAAQAAQGLTANAVRAIGITPPFETVDEDAPLADEIAIDGEDEVRTITEE